MKKVRISYFLISLVLAIALLLSAGCSLVPGLEPTPAPPPAPQPTAPASPEWTMPSPENGASPLPNIASVVAEVRPSVTAINTEFINYDIFNRSSTQQGAGSGWIIDEGGLIVTNNHVIENAQSITATLADGRTFSARIIGTDALSDLAVLKIDADGLTSVKTGDSSQLAIGDWLVAIGNALGMGISAKEGIVSRLGVSIQVSEGQMLDDLIETSAAINPGNSGGPLVNMSGEVIGITSIKITTIEVEGIGYAISMNSAAPIIEKLVQNGYVTRPWLGVVLTTVDQWLAMRYNLGISEGVFLTQVAPGSPADVAGLKAQDVIVTWNDTAISNARELMKAIHESQIGEEITVTFWRGKEQMNTLVTLSESPAPG
ncbi:S1C family serine protease [Chloroflexota bacterium]